LEWERKIDRIRYAPLDTSSGLISYDYKWEVHSFGILLWEIAEARIPFENLEHLSVDKIYQIRFSENNQIPREYKSLAISGM
jgi:hypothetical protein